MAIKIITDSTSYIPKEIQKELDISVVSLSVVMEDQSYLETDIDLSIFYDKLSKVNKLPTSSQPSIDDMYNIFEKHILNGDDLIGIFISSEMSGTYSTSLLVKSMILEKYPNAKIELIDSRTNCMEMGLVVIAAAKASKEGKSMDEIVKLCHKTMRCTRFLFVPNTLEYLKKGGRIGNASSLLADILKIKPILTVKDGVTTTFSKIRTQQKALNHIIQVFSKDIKEYGYANAIIHHIHCPEEAIKFANNLMHILEKQPSIISIGAVIGTHVGPGTMGIAYCTNEPWK